MLSMSDFNYTDEMYKEDVCISNYVFKKYRAQFQFHEWQDVISECLIKLHRARQLHDPTKTKYMTYACSTCHNTIRMALRYKNKPTRKDVLSLDEKIETNSGNITLQDRVSAPIDENSDKRDIVIETLDSCKNPKIKQCVLLYIYGLSQKEIAGVVGLAQSYVSRLIRKFNAMCQAELARCA